MTYNYFDYYNNWIVEVPEEPIDQFQIEYYYVNQEGANPEIRHVTLIYDQDFKPHDIHGKWQAMVNGKFKARLPPSFFEGEDWREDIYSYVILSPHGTNGQGQAIFLTEAEAKAEFRKIVLLEIESKYRRVDSLRKLLENLD